MGEYPLFDVYLGDDSLAIVPPEARVSLEGIAEVALDKFSAVLNTEKSYITTNRNNISFLGYYNDNGRPTRDQAFLIASACFPEHPIFQDSDTLARCIGQMWTTLSPEATYKWYLVCEDICKYIGMTMDQGYEEIRNKPFRFKFLMTLGIDISKMYPPTIVHQMVWNVALAAPRRKLTMHRHPTSQTWRDFKTWIFNQESLLSLPVLENDREDYTLDYDPDLDLSIGFVVAQLAM